MIDMDAASWHGRLFAFSYSIFDAEPPRVVNLWSYGVSACGGALFLAFAAILLVVLNVASLPFGVFCEPIWRRDAKFARLAFPGGIPVIAVALPILLSIVAVQIYEKSGLFAIIRPFAFVAGLGLLLLGLVIMFNRLRRRLPQIRLTSEHHDAS